MAVANNSIDLQINSASTDILDGTTDTRLWGDKATLDDGAFGWGVCTVKADMTTGTAADGDGVRVYLALSAGDPDDATPDTAFEYPGDTDEAGTGAAEYEGKQVLFLNVYQNDPAIDTFWFPVVGGMGVNLFFVSEGITGSEAITISAVIRYSYDDGT